MGQDLDATGDRRAIVMALMRAEAPADEVNGEPTATVASLGRLCQAAKRYLDAVGVAVGLMSDAGSAGVVASADEASALLDELQFSLGEGPGLDAHAKRRPVLILDLNSAEGAAWPIYRADALKLGASGVFSFPIHVGAIAFGVFTVYTEGGPMTPEHMKMSLTFAEIATEILLNADPSPDDGSLHPGVEAVLGHRAEIYQAQGVISVRLGIDLAESMLRMRAHAFAKGQTLAELAVLIMSDEVDLSDPDD